MFILWKSEGEQNIYSALYEEGPELGEGEGEGGHL